MADKNTAMWGGYPLLNPKDAEKLELEAAVQEFHHGHDRKTAEQMALDAYRREHHARGAAHHLQGMRAAQASGDAESAQKHFDFYGLHLKALGHEPSDAVPPEVKQYSEGEQAERAYRFKAHGADQFLVQPVQGPVPEPAQQLVQKSESTSSESHLSVVKALQEMGEQLKKALEPPK